MCEPLTLATLGLSLAQNAVGYQAARSSYKAGMEAYRQNAANAAKSTADQYSKLGIRKQQEDAAAHQEQEQSNLNIAQAVASAEVAAGAGNVGGLAVGNVIRDLYAQQGRSDAILDANRRMSSGFFASEAKSIEATGQSQINSMPIPERPSALPFVLSTFGDGLNSYTAYKRHKEAGYG